jgi:type IV pilus assembly protein PilA
MSGAIDTMTSLNPSLRLALINKAKSKKNILQKGFTLVELMTVVVIVGVLSAVAFPQFLGLKEKAQGNASVGEIIGLAKECSTAIRVDGPYPSSGPCATTTTGTGDSAVTNPPSTPVTFESEYAFTGECGSLAITEQKCTIEVGSDGGLTYSASS